MSSNYPGEPPEDTPPSPPASGTPDESGTEPTQPVGYWERQAAEQAAEQARQQGQGHEQGQPPGWGQAPPTTPYPQDSGAQSPYGQVPPGQPPYGGQPYGQAPQAQSPYPVPPPGYAAAPGQPTGYPPYAFSPPVPDHPQSTLALILGLVGLVGAMLLCGVTLIVSPFAWAVGRSSLKEIEASQGRLGGEGNARAGMVMGIIGTVLLVLAVIAVIGFVVLVVAAGTASTTGSSV